MVWYPGPARWFVGLSAAASAAQPKPPYPRLGAVMYEEKRWGPQPVDLQSCGFMSVAIEQEKGIYVTKQYMSTAERNDRVDLCNPSKLRLETMSDTPNGSSPPDVKAQTTFELQTPPTQTNSNLNSNSSDPEKDILEVYDGNRVDTPSNEGRTSDERGGLKRPQSKGSHRKSLSSHDSPQVTKEDIESSAVEASAEDVDPNVVWWDGPNDPENPMNFSSWVKGLNITLVSAVCFVTPLASSMFAPGVPQLMREFESTNTELASFVVSVYILGFALGPLFLAPLSEIYGRLPLYHICNVGFVAFTIACAVSTNLNMLIGFRFMAGIFGSGPLTNGGGTIADIIHQKDRGRAMSAWVMGPMIGPIVGPIAGGYLSEAKGWRWVFWLLTMISGAFLILSAIFMRETYAPVLLSRKAARLRKETGNKELRSKLDAGLSPKDFFMRSIIRPAKMLTRSPVVITTCVFVGLVYGYLYLLFTTFTIVFQGNYNFSSGSAGLSFLGIGVGSFMGLLFFGWSSDRTIKKRTAEADAIAAASGQESAGMKPEYRLALLVPTYLLIPTGLFLYGWTAKYHVHWIVPIMSTALIGIGNLSVFMCITTYLVDAFTIYAASALAANTIVRSLMGAVLPLAGEKMYLTLGLGWGNSLLAFVALAFVPIPWVLVRWGENIRKKFEVKNL